MDLNGFFLNYVYLMYVRLCCCVYLLFIIAAPVLLGKASGSTYVTMNTNITLTVDVSADPAPVATWQLDGADLAAMTTTTLK